MSLRVLIADDEPLARERVRDLIATLPDFEIVGECADGRETVEAVRSSAPDLLFLDVQMPELDGFGVLEQLESHQRPPVIFLTAYDHYAVKAFQVNALDYLLKPLDPQRFRESVERAKDAILSRKETRISEDLLRLLSRRSHDEYLTRVVIRVGARILFVPAADIDWIESEENYVRVHWGSAGHLLRHTLAGLEKKLDPRIFARIQRGVIVNTTRVVEMERLSRNEYVVVLQNGTRLPLSNFYKSNIESVLGHF